MGRRKGFRISAAGDVAGFGQQALYEQFQRAGDDYRHRLGDLSNFLVSLHDSFDSTLGDKQEIWWEICIFLLYRFHFWVPTFATTSDGAKQLAVRILTAGKRALYFRFFEGILIGSF